MNSYIILFVSLIIGFILSNMGVKPVSDFMNINDLLPIVTANLWVDLAIIFIAMSGIIFTGKDTTLNYTESVLSKAQNQPAGFTSAKWELKLTYTQTNTQTGIQHGTDEITFFIKRNNPVYNPIGIVLDYFVKKTFLTNKLSG